MRALLKNGLFGFTLGLTVAATAVALAAGGERRGEAPDVPIPVSQLEQPPPTPVSPPDTEKANWIGDNSDPPVAVDECRHYLAWHEYSVDATDHLMYCEIVVGKADNKLPPGGYSDSELRTALAEAEK